MEESAGKPGVFLLRFSESALDATSELEKTATQRGVVEVEGEAGTSLLVNGEALREGERRRLSEGDLLVLVAGGLEFMVRESRRKEEAKTSVHCSDVHSPSNLDPQPSTLNPRTVDVASSTVDDATSTVLDAMACPICLATVLPSSLHEETLLKKEPLQCALISEPVIVF